MFLSHVSCWGSEDALRMDNAASELSNVDDEVPVDWFLTEDEKRLRFSVFSIGTRDSVSVTLGFALDELQMVRTRSFLRVWPAARALSNSLVDATWTKPVLALELGAGPGLCGIALALAWQASSLPTSKVVVTDGDEDVVDLLRVNCARNEVAQLAVERLRWGNDNEERRILKILGSRPTLILGSDVAYTKEGSRLLMQTAARLLDPQGIVMLALSWPRFRAMEEHLVEEAKRCDMELTMRCLERDSHSQRDILLLNFSCTERGLS